MAISSLKYKKLLRKLMPTGWAWQAKSIDEGTLSKLLGSLALEGCRIEEAGFNLVEGIYPDTAVEYLEDWERLLGLPDECDNTVDPTIEERQSRVVQILTIRGGQNAQYFKELAGRFGFDINEIEVIDHVPFRAGQARAGDAITNGDWIYAFTIVAPVAVGNLTQFRAGVGRAGDRLLTATNATLTCLLQKYKPAHTIVLFSFK